MTVYVQQTWALTRKPHYPWAHFLMRESLFSFTDYGSGLFEKTEVLDALGSMPESAAEGSEFCVNKKTPLPPNVLNAKRYEWTGHNSLF